MSGNLVTSFAADMGLGFAASGSWLNGLQLCVFGGVGEQAFGLQPDPGIHPIARHSRSHFARHLGRHDDLGWPFDDYGDVLTAVPFSDHHREPGRAAQVAFSY